MNNVAGSKKSINALAAEGIAESKTMRAVNTQNIPKRALGNLMAAATKARFRNLSAARINPRETTRCRRPITCTKRKRILFMYKDPRIWNYMRSHRSREIPSNIRRTDLHPHLGTRRWRRHWRHLFRHRREGGADVSSPRHPEGENPSWASRGPCQGRPWLLRPPAMHRNR